MAVGYPQDVSATIAPFRISCRSGHCCGLWALQLARTVNCWPPLTFISPSDTMGVGFCVNSSWIPPRPASKVCGVFSNRILPSSSGRHPRSIAITYIVWGALGFPRQIIWKVSRSKTEVFDR